MTKSYIVTKKELWNQRVIVRGADSPAGARVKAEMGQYEIFEDPQYDKDCSEELWFAEETDE
jgi:hypothetical protein